MKKDDLPHIASLAKLRFEDTAEVKMLKDMRAILDYVARLEKFGANRGWFNITNSREGRISKTGLARRRGGKNHSA